MCVVGCLTLERMRPRIETIGGMVNRPRDRIAGVTTICNAHGERQMFTNARRWAGIEAPDRGMVRVTRM